MFILIWIYAVKRLGYIFFIDKRYINVIIIIIINSKFITKHLLTGYRSTCVLLDPRIKLLSSCLRHSAFNFELRQYATRVPCPCELTIVYKIVPPFTDIACTELNRQYIHQQLKCRQGGTMLFYSIYVKMTYNIIIMIILLDNKMWLLYQLT